MYTVKFVPYPHGSEGRKDIHVLATDEYKWNVKYPSNSKELKEILSEEAGFIVIWELPLILFPDDGIQVVILTTYRNTNPDSQGSLRVDTYIAYDCSVFVMNDNGKTIDRIG